MKSINTVIIIFSRVLDICGFSPNFWLSSIKKKERKNGDKFDSLEPNPSRGYCLIIIFITIINKK